MKKKITFPSSSFRNSVKNSLLMDRVPTAYSICFAIAEDDWNPVLNMNEFSRSWVFTFST